jgi:hypothetical protein
MGQRGRKSAAAGAVTAVDGRTSRLRPPPSLNQAERAIFLDIVGSTDAGHFVAADLPLMSAYVRAVAQEELSGRELQRGGYVVNGRPSPWIVIQEKSVRAVTALAARLRLCPQSRRQYAKPAGRPMSYYERMAMEEGEDE